jgi:hypothetical protein
VVPGDLVELVAMDEQVALAIGRDVLVVELHADVSEQRADVRAASSWLPGTKMTCTSWRARFRIF